MRTAPVVSVGTPAPLFELKRPWVAYDLSSTGRLLAIVRETNAAEQPLTAVLKWTAELAKP
jgi:hypothetical protein